MKCKKYKSYQIDRTKYIEPKLYNIPIDCTETIEPKLVHSAHNIKFE